MSLYAPAYIERASYLYLNGNELRLVVMKGRIRNSDVEAPSSSRVSSPILNLDDNPKDRLQRLAPSLSRSKRMINEFAANNSWDWWFTGTLNSDLFDRYDLEKFHASFTRFLRSLSYTVAFLIVPEPHKDGAVHVHGFLSGIPKAELHKFVIGDTMGKEIAKLVLAGEDVYTWPAYSNRYGFCSLRPVISIDRASKYICKYIDKDLASFVPDGKQCFWHSRGLNKAKLICKGSLLEELPFIPASQWYDAEHCRIATMPYSQILADTIEGYIA